MSGAGRLFWLFIIPGILFLPVMPRIFCIMLIMELHRCIISIIIRFICACVGGFSWAWARISPEGAADWLWWRAMVDVVTWPWFWAFTGTAVNPNSAKPAAAPLMIVFVRVVLLITNPQSSVNQLLGNQNYCKLSSWLEIQGRSSDNFAIT